MSGAFFKFMVKDIILTAVVLIVLLLIWIAVFDTNRFTVSSYEYKNRKIRKSFRAVFISDLHNKRYGKNNIKLLEAISHKKPDIILIGGDVLNGNPKCTYDIALEFLENVSKIAPVYYANGNHEMRMELYTEDYGQRYEEYCHKLDEFGINHLVNDRRILKEYGICVIGAEIDRIYYRRLGITPMDSKVLYSIAGQPEKDDFNILLAHNPDYFDNYAEYGAELVLSGHVHGGIVRIPFIKKGVLSPNISFFPKYYAGEYTKKNVSMIVSRGLGAHTIPFRMFNPGDLVVIDFKSAEE